MAKITASDVNKLRKQTGAGMMDCKKALVEAEGEFDKAIDLLRKKGQKVAAKRGDREASEGLVIAKANGNNNNGVIVVVNCETDFVAKNDDFNKFAASIADIAMSNKPSNVDELKALAYSDDLTIAEKLTEQIGVIGEKIDVSGYSNISADTVIAYNHPGNQVASLVGLNQDNDAASSAGRDVAMQIAAMAPVALDKDQVPQEIIDKEIEIGKEQAANEGKPAEIAEKIAKGKVNKFLQENTLLNQAFIKENKKTVQQYLKEQSNDLTVTEFARYALN